MIPRTAIDKLHRDTHSRPSPTDTALNDVLHIALVNDGLNIDRLSVIIGTKNFVTKPRASEISTTP